MYMYLPNDNTCYNISCDLLLDIIIYRHNVKAVRIFKRGAYLLPWSIFQNIDLEPL